MIGLDTVTLLFTCAVAAVVSAFIALFPGAAGVGAASG